VLLEVAKQAPALIVALAALGVLGAKLDRLSDRVDRLAEVLLGHEPEQQDTRRATRSRKPRAEARPEAEV
jgi:hypothetical protein